MSLTKEDFKNIDKWITAAGMMIEAKLRTPFTPSEHETFAKLNRIQREAEG